MAIHYGKYFYCNEPQKPSLADLPPSCMELRRKNEDIFNFDFKKFRQSVYDTQSSRIKSVIDSNQTSNNYQKSNTKYSDTFNRKRQNYGLGLNGGLNFDYTNMQTDSNYGSKYDQNSNSRYDQSSKNDNFFSNKISMSPPPGENIFTGGSSKSNNYNNNNFNNTKNSRNSNYNDNINSNYNYNTNASNYSSKYDKFNSSRPEPKISSIENYDYLDKTSSKRTNDFQTSKKTHHSKSSKLYTSNAPINSDNKISHTKQNQSSLSSRTKPSNANKSSTINSTYVSNTNSSSNQTRTSTTNSTFTSKANSSSKSGSLAPTKLHSNVVDDSGLYSKKTTVYDYSKPNPAGIYNQDLSSRTNSYKTSNSTTTTTKNISNRNNFDIQNQSSSIRSTSTTTSANINNRNNFNIQNQPSSSSRQQYTSTSSKLTTNSVKGSKSSVSNLNTRFTTTSDLLNQAPRFNNGGSQFQSRTQNQTRTSVQQPYYDDIRQPNLTQYAKPQGGKSSTYLNESSTTKITSNSQAQFIAHQAQYSGNSDMSRNAPTSVFSKKNAISNPGYDFLQSNGQNLSQSQSLMNEGGAGNDSFTIDPDPKKTRVEFPEPQTAPKPFQRLDMSLEGEVSQEEAKKVEDLNDLMKSFHADSDPENELDNFEANDNDNNTTINNKTENSKTGTSFRVEDLKKGLFSSSLIEEEEEEHIELDIQEENEKNNNFQHLEDLSDFEDIEKKSKDFDDQNILIDEEEEINDDENKLEIASSEDSPNESSLQKVPNNIKPNPVKTNKEEEEDLIEDDEDLMQSVEIQNLLNRFKKSIDTEEEDENTAELIKNAEGEGNTIDLIKNFEEEDENTAELIKNLEEEDYNFKQQDQNNNEFGNKENNQNEDKTVEDVFLEEEENESMIEKVNVNINLSDDDNNDDQNPIENLDDKNKLNNDKLDDDFKFNFDNEEEESENDLSLEEILKKAAEQHLISPSDENYDEEESFANQENKTPISHFKKPLKFLAQNITNNYSSGNNGTNLAFEFADRILKKQLLKILSLAK